MMPLYKSLLLLAIVPGAVAFIVIVACNSRWPLPWWGVIGAGFGGWLLGLMIAAAFHVVVDVEGRNKG